MAYIAPNSEIRLLRGIPLDSNYEHTWYFPNTDAQFNKMVGYTHSIYQYNSYLRHTRNAIKINAKIEDIILCNYMMFKNNSFENKWFYAFIDNIEYVNNETSVITYHLDVMQTWLTNYTIDQCFVERTHTGTDSPGDNLVPENLEIGEYVDTNVTVMTGGTPQIIVARTFDDSGAPVGGSLGGSIFNALRIDVYDNNAVGRTALNNWLTTDLVQQKVDGIVAIYYCPSGFANGGSTVAANRVYRPASIDGYTPKNKKLLTYPYVFDYITNQQGVGAEFPYEYFTNAFAQYTIYGTNTPDVNLMLVPVNYKGQATNEDYGIPLSGFPMCAFNVDAFKAWIAQNKGAIVSEGISNVIKTIPAAVSVASGVSMLTPSIINAGVDALGDTARMMGSIRDHYVKPPQNCGKITNTALYAAGRFGYIGYTRTITAQFARIIDDYFQKYGYAVHRVMRPIQNARRWWTFIKTVGCSISGVVPSEDAKIIESVYDKGVTFWASDANFCDYSPINYIT